MRVVATVGLQDQARERETSLRCRRRCGRVGAWPSPQTGPPAVIRCSSRGRPPPTSPCTGSRSCRDGPGRDRPSPASGQRGTVGGWRGMPAARVFGTRRLAIWTAISTIRRGRSGTTGESDPYPIACPTCSTRNGHPWTLSTLRGTGRQFLPGGPLRHSADAASASSRCRRAAPAGATGRCRAAPGPEGRGWPDAAGRDRASPASRCPRPGDR